MRAELRAVADIQVFLALGMTLLGLGMVVGNYAGGKFADRRLMPTVLTNHLALGIALFAVSVIGFATVAPLQTVTVRRAAQAPTLASVLNIGAFNVGNAVAAGALVLAMFSLMISLRQMAVA